jgi:hypothetical protein
MTLNSSSKQPPPSYLPPRDRRRGKRYLTLKNFAIVLLVVAVGFTGLSLRSEMRRPKPGQYGELFRIHTRESVDKLPVKVPVVTEAPVPEKPSVDPMNLDQVNRAEWLEGEEDSSSVTTASTSQPFMIEPQYSSRTHSRIRISGGANGIWVERKPQ